MNEIAQLCEKLGADVDMVRRGIGSDERIGKRFLFPGIGYGGSCFPKDVQALVKSSDEVDYDFKILDAVMEVNEKQKLHLIPKIKSYFKDNLQGNILLCGDWPSNQIQMISAKPGFVYDRCVACSRRNSYCI